MRKAETPLDTAIGALREIAVGWSRQAKRAKAALADLDVGPVRQKRRNGPHGSRKHGQHTRFDVGAHVHVERVEAALSPEHRAVRDGTTLFPSRVFDASDVDHVLVSGLNSAKIGKRIVKGAWRGLPVFTLTLEERRTCPRTCTQWDTCYGNGTPLAKRLAYTPELMASIEAELGDLADAHAGGFAVRLHSLGDFPDEAYVRQWAHWLLALPTMRIFGFTAWAPESVVGEYIEAMNAEAPDRCAIRFSVSDRRPIGPMQATTIWRAVPPGTRQVAEGTLCPQQTGATAACVTCGLCWAPAAADKRIVFMGHGRIGGRSRKVQE